MARLNREQARRVDVVGICPNGAAVLRRAGAVLREPEDEGNAAPRRYFRQTSMDKWQPWYTATLTTQEVGA